MNTHMHGRRIKSVVWPDNTGVDSGDDGRFFYLSATHHGDRDEFWVVETDESGKEIGRYNCRYIDAIIWSDN